LLAPFKNIVISIFVNRSFYLEEEEEVEEVEIDFSYQDFPLVQLNKNIERNLFLQ
jgi:hypothetical protein